MSTAPPSPLSLALVITELEIGGAEQALVNLAIGLSRERFGPVVYSLAPRPENDLLVQRLEKAGVPVHFLGLRSRWQFFSAVSRLTQLFREQQPQVVQSFLFHANVVATLAARRAKVPRMVTGIRVADPSFWRQRVERWLTPKVDKIICVSQAVADFCRDRGFPEEKLIVIPNGVDMSRFENVTPADLMELGVPADRRAILYVGRLDRQKGLDWLLEKVMPRVFRELQGHDLLLVGDGPERQELLQKQIDQQELRGRVHFLGWQSDVPGILSASDLLVLASRWEGMPNVVLEAMAAGKPVVATQAEGVLELLGDGAAEQSCPAGDAAGFAERIIRLAHDRELAARIGAQNQRRAAAGFSLPAMISRYEAIAMSSSFSE